ncbi:MAG: VCBS repeat-containing protein, partial [Chlorobi bacterium]|nr:VCBS repeat-containing protein [Chlorobiota bacterium]
MKQGIIVIILTSFFCGFLHSQTSIEKTHPISNDFTSPFSVSVIDMDNDGDNDIIAGSAFDIIAWFENDGFGNFGTAITITTELDNVRSVFGCDMDGDGDVDVLSASKNDNVISWIENEGNNVFGSPIILSSNANYAKYVSGHDIDNDGDIDVLAGYQYKVVWFENDGSNNFGPEKIIANNTSYRMAADDIDGDGDIDIFTRITHVDNSEINLIWYKNNGDKTFSEQYVQTPFSFSECLDIDVYDIDGDGQKDIIASFYSINSWSADKIAWFRNEGNDTFLFEGYATSNSRFPQKITAFDIDMDGDGDIFGALTESGNVKWFRNWDNSFSDKVIASGIDVTIDLAIADMDMDNDMDVIVSSSNRSKVFWIENSTLEILAQPNNKTICPLEDISYTISIKDAEQYQWQVKKPGDTYFNDIEGNDFYFGETTNELQITGPPLGMKDFQYRCIASNEAGYLISDTLRLSMYEDIEAPVLETNDFDLYLQNTVQTKLSSSDVVESLTDNCFYTKVSLSKSIFDCSDLGEESIDI